MLEEEIKFKSNTIELAGTLTLPDADGTFPAVLLIAGSGPVDRNENVKKMKINAFFDISHYLAQNGIASLRYDKRGIGQSEGDHWTTGFYDLVQDAHAALEFLKQQKNIQPNRIFILGHSEGSMIATRLAGIGAEVAGIMLIAGPAQSGEDILKWQALQVINGIKGFNGIIIKIFQKFHYDFSKKQQKAIDKIKNSKKDCYKEKHLIKVPAKWFREFFAYNPADDFPKIKIPVLAITGSKDIQVDPADLEKMANLIKSPFEYHVIENMTHMLRVEEDEASISKYKKEIKRPIEPELLKLVLDWLKNKII